MEEIFYVHIENSREFRKNSLEATRLVIQTLQSVDRLKKIRAGKADAIKKLCDLMAEMDKLCDEVKIVPPPLNVATKVEKKPLKKQQQKINPEATALEQAISQIEQKLRKL
jgi:predicted nuclease with TOPRIM domain